MPRFEKKCVEKAREETNCLIYSVGVRACGLMYVFSLAFYSSASKTSNPVPCSPSRLAARSLPLTSSIEAVNKYMESTTLYHPLIALENRSVTERSPLGGDV